MLCIVYIQLCFKWVAAGEMKGKAVLAAMNCIYIQLCIEQVAAGEMKGKDVLAAMY